MVKENLALSDFSKANVYASGVENTARQKIEAKDLPICHTAAKAAAVKPVKVVKNRRVAVR